MDRGRRRQSEELVTDARGAGHSGTGERSAIQDRRRPHGASEGTGSPAVRAIQDPDRRALAGRARGSGVPAGPVNDMLQALSDPQTIAREMVIDVEHCSLGKVKTMGLPIKFSATPGGVRSGAPLYGQHGDEVLGAYGFDAAEIAALREEGAVAPASRSRRGRLAGQGRISGCVFGAGACSASASSGSFSPCTSSARPIQSGSAR